MTLTFFQSHGSTLKYPKYCFIANSSACTTTELSILLTSCLTAIKNNVIKYCTTDYERNGKNLFWSIKISGEIVNKLKSRGFLASGLSTYDFSTLYTTLPHNLIKEKVTELIEQTFNREGSLYLACNDKNAFFTSEQPKRYKLWSCCYDIKPVRKEEGKSYWKIPLCDDDATREK